MTTHIGNKIFYQGFCIAVKHKTFLVIKTYPNLDKFYVESLKTICENDNIRCLIEHLDENYELDYWEF